MIAWNLIPRIIWPRGVNRKGLVDVKAAVQYSGQRYLMPFYRFQVCDPIIPIDGHGHDGAALGDDIDAKLFAAGIIQKLFQERRSVPRNWAIRITQDSRRVSVLPFEAGLKVLVRPYWGRDQPTEPHEVWR